MSAGEDHRGDLQESMPISLTVRIPVAMRMLGLGRSKIYELMDEGAIDSIKVGRARLVVTESLHAFVKSKSRRTT